MSNRNMRAGLRHTRPGLRTEEFFRMIDETGGWPVGFTFVGFVHSDEREAGFCNSRSNTGWWTVVASSDDYYLWKLSREAVQHIADDAVKAFLGAVHWTRPDVTKITFRTASDWFYKVPATQEPA
jgi:hypothetical protein